MPNSSETPITALSSTQKKIIEARMLEDQTQRQADACLYPTQNLPIGTNHNISSNNICGKNNGMSSAEKTTNQSNVDAKIHDTSHLSNLNIQKANIDEDHLDIDKMMEDARQSENLGSPIKRRIEENAKSAVADIDGSLTSLQAWKAEREANLKKFAQEYEISNTPRDKGDIRIDNNNNVDDNSGNDTNTAVDVAAIDRKIRQIQSQQEEERVKILAQSKEAEAKLSKILAESKMKRLDLPPTPRGGGSLEATGGAGDTSEVELKLEKLEMDLKIAEIQKKAKMDDLDLDEEGKEMLRANAEKMRALELELQSGMVEGVDLSLGLGDRNNDLEDVLAKLDFLDQNNS